MVLRGGGGGGGGEIAVVERQVIVCLVVGFAESIIILFLFLYASFERATGFHRSVDACSFFLCRD